MSVKLLDLSPAWIDLPAEGRKGLGIAFNCLVGSHAGKPCTIRLWILFSNPLDGGEPWPGESRSLIAKLLPGEDDRCQISGCGKSRWTRTGDTFEALSMKPSVNAHSCGHMTLTDGVFK